MINMRITILLLESDREKNKFAIIVAKQVVSRWFIDHLQILVYLHQSDGCLLKINSFNFKSNIPKKKWGFLNQKQSETLNSLVHSKT